MPRTLGPIPLGTPITDRDGTITAFFRQRWQDVDAGWAQTGTVARLSLPTQSGAGGFTRILTVVTAGLYRVSWYLRRTRIDGVSASVQVHLQFTDTDGQVLYFSGPASTVDTLQEWQGVVTPLRCAAPSNVNLFVTYSSTTPGQMQYDLEIAAEFLP
jgi:hypothetical protein